MNRKKSIKKSSSSSSSSCQHSLVEDDDQILPFLHASIVTEILSWLSVRSIFRCRCVCKTWLDILSSALFAKLHFSRSHTCPLLWNARPKGTPLSGSLYLVELERDVCSKMLGPESCDIKHCCLYRRGGNFKICSGHANVKLATNFALPKVVDSGATQVMVMDVVNSCNGLLCLRNDPIVIYNPVLRECGMLPQSQQNRAEYVFGLGFSPRNNQYKVLRVATLKPQFRLNSMSRVVEVHTLGTTSWRSIGSVHIPFSLTIRNNKRSFPIFSNGALHWFIENYFSYASPIVSFNFEDEKFGKIELPKRSKHDRCFLGMGELRGCLCISKLSIFSEINLWVMKDYGIKESWTKDFKICCNDGDRWPRGSIMPIDILSNGDLLIYSWDNAIISYNTWNFKYFKIRGSKSKFLVIPHTPSFISLKDVMGDNVTVLNVRARGRRTKKGKTEDAITAIPRFGKFVVSAEPTKALFLVEEDTDEVLEFLGESDDFCDYEDDFWD